MAGPIAHDRPHSGTSRTCAPPRANPCINSRKGYSCSPVVVPRSLPADPQFSFLWVFATGVDSDGFKRHPPNPTPRSVPELPPCKCPRSSVNQRHVSMSTVLLLAQFVMNYGGWFIASPAIHKVTRVANLSRLKRPCTEAMSV